MNFVFFFFYAGTDRLVQWSQAVFNNNSQMIFDIARKIGYTGSICSIPVPDQHNNTYSTSLAQLNITMPWYKGWRMELEDGQAISGTSVVEAIDSIRLPFLRPPENCFRASVISTVLAGIPTVFVQVLSGYAKVGTILKLIPHNTTFTISGIQIVEGESIKDFESTQGPGTRAFLELEYVYIIGISSGSSDFSKAEVRNIETGNIFYSTVTARDQTAFFKVRILVHNSIPSISVTSGFVVVKVYLGSGPVQCQVAEISSGKTLGANFL
jgi:translation elongation factor EF-1alpha